MDGLRRNNPAPELYRFCRAAVSRSTLGIFGTSVNLADLADMGKLQGFGQAPPPRGAPIQPRHRDLMHLVTTIAIAIPQSS